MHHNDTLQGKLFAYEREDEKHLRHSFGYWRMVEERMITADLEAQGIPPEGSFAHRQLVLERIRENHKDDVSYREQCEALTVWRLAHAENNWRNGRRERPLGLNLPEMLWLAARLEGVNEPEGVAILDKLKAALGDDC